MSHAGPANSHIRRATSGEAGLLSEIARTAKAHWGYTEQDLARWAPDLTVAPRSIAGHPTFVIEIDGVAVGFCQLAVGEEQAELEHLWVLPAHMGKGLGRALLRRACAELVNRGLDEMVIDSDPNAEAFYLACGAVRTGAIPAPLAAQPDRMRPQLVLGAGAI